jgi:hypothetical protein
VEIFQDTKCSRALGIHWGTFSMTSEPVDEPPEKLKEALKIKGLAQRGLFDVCAVGEGREFLSVEPHPTVVMLVMRPRVTPAQQPQSTWLVSNASG